MSIESISLVDAVYSARLTYAGLPALANVEEAVTGTAPASDPYATPSSSLTTLSGYGQLLSSASRAADDLQNLLGTGSNLASSSASSVATASADSTASAGSHTVVVSQVAKAQILTSSVFADDDATVFSAGTFTLQVGDADPTTVTLSTGTSLNGLMSAINGVSAGVTASIESDAYGHKLKLTTNSTGAANTISMSATADDPFEGGDDILSALAFTQSQAAQDAQYTVNGNAGTSTSNSSISAATGVSFSIVGTGTTTITVASTSFVAADSSSITTAANQLVASYNALMGTAAQLIGTGGALNGDTTTATPLSTALYNYTQGTNKTYANGSSSLTELSHLGITGAGPTTGVLSLNTTTLTAAITGDTAGAASLVGSIVNTLHSQISAYLGSSGTILTNAKNLEENMTFLNGAAASSYPNLSDDIKQYVLQKSLSNAGTPTGLPEISVFA